MSTVAVLGASGFVARYFISAAMESGHEIRGFARHAPADGTVPTSHDKFTFHRGDVRDFDTVLRVLTGCDIVVHMATSLSEDDDTRDIIVRGTKTVIQAAKEAGVKRLVYLSCLGALASSASPVYEALWRAETEVRSSDVPYTILQSSVAVGRGDYFFGPIAKISRTLRVIPMPRETDHRLQPIAVTDLARCLVQALQSEELLHETVAVGGPSFLTIHEAFDLVSRVIGVRRPKVMLPDVLSPTIASFLSPPMRHLFVGPRSGLLRHGIVTSPGIVERNFKFKPEDVLGHAATYLA